MFLFPFLFISFQNTSTEKFLTLLKRLFEPTSPLYLSCYTSTTTSAFSWFFFFQRGSIVFVVVKKNYNSSLPYFYIFSILHSLLRTRDYVDSLSAYRRVLGVQYHKCGKTSRGQFYNRPGAKRRFHILYRFYYLTCTILYTLKYSDLVGRTTSECVTELNFFTRLPLLLDTRRILCGLSWVDSTRTWGLGIHPLLFIHYKSRRPKHHYNNV